MRLTAWIVLLFIPLLVSAVVMAHLSTQFTTSQSETTLSQFRDLQASSVNRKIEQYLQTADALATQPALVTMMELYDQFRLKKTSSPLVDEGLEINGVRLPVTDLGKPQPLQSLVQLISKQKSSVEAHVYHIKLIDPTGKNLGESDDVTWTSFDQALAFRSMKQKRPIFGEVSESVTGEPQLPLITPVYGSNGRLLGALKVERTVVSLLDSVNDSERQRGNLEAYVLRSDASGTPRLLSERRAGASIDTTINEAPDRSETTIEHLNEGQNTTLIARSSLWVPGWFLITQSDHSSQSALLEKQKNILLAALLLSAIFGLLGWFFVLRAFNKRLAQVSQATQKMVKRDYSNRIEDKTPDQLGSIARQLDQIAGEMNEGVSVRVAVEERLQQLANKDELTGFYNESFLEEELTRLKSENESLPLTVVNLCLTEYRNLKAAHGDTVAEQILTSVSRHLRAALDHQYLVARKNGNQFVVVAENTDKEAAATLVTTIENIFTTTFETAAGELLVACETTATTITSGDAASETEHDAEKIDPPTPVTEEKSPAAVSAKQIKLIETAIREQRVSVWYQPVVRLEDGASPTMVSAEGFVRVTDESGEVIPPNTFMPHIEESPIGMVLDRCMLIQAIQSLKQWVSSDKVAEDFCLSINLSRQSVQSMDIVKFLKDQLDSADIAPSRLALEVTGDTQLTSTDVILELQELGLLVSMDNVGLQHTNIEQLISIRPAFAKIDQRRLRSEDNAERNRDIETRLDTIWTIMGMEIVAKSVESADQIAELVSRGIRIFQGFLFDHPRDADSFIDLWGRKPGDSIESEELRKSA